MKTSFFLVLSKLGISLGTVLALAGCLPTNNFTSNLGANAGSGAGVATVANVVTAAIKPPCDQYDPSNPTQGICTSCYQSILSVRCATKTDFNDCIDPSVKANYVTLVNQCISQTVSSGFTCPLTNCTLGQVIDPRTCTCVAPTPNPTNVGGSLYVDVGQTDFGPPVVSAQFPQAGVTGTPFPTPAPAPAPTPTSCIGTMDIPLGILDRGNTVFRLNHYSNPVLSSVPDLELTAPNYLSSASVVRAYNSTQMAASPGNNASTSILFRTGGASEITGQVAPPLAGASGGFVSYINTVSGQTSDGQSYSGDNGDQKAAQWTQPGFGARDLNGNVYFSDVISSTVRVICYNPVAGHPFCPATVAVGLIVPIAGVAGQAGYTVGTDEGKVGTTATLYSPHGIAVDKNFNVYIADSGNHAIRIVCGLVGAGKICDNTINKVLGMAEAAVATGKIYTAVGIAAAPAFDGALDPARLNYPYGVDVTVSGINANIYVAEYQGHTIRAFCMYVSGGCTVPGNINSILGGSGHPGFLLDGTASLHNITSNDVAFPTDVKVDWAGNLIYADSYNHLVRAYCYNSTSDFCSGAAGPFPKVITLAGKHGQAGDLGTGIAGNLALVTLPNQLVIAKQFADDTNLLADATRFVGFRDNNLVFTEKLLAPGQNKAQSIPLPISGLTSVASLAMGSFHTCAVTLAGTVSCMGDNSNSQIGNAGAGNPQSVPTAVSPLAGAREALGAGSNHTCSASANKTAIQCWGADSKGQLGDNGTANSIVPLSVTGSPGGTQSWTAITGGDAHTCAFENTTQKVFCWGENASGQLGRGDTTPEPFMTIAAINPTGGAFTDGISAGANHTCTPITTAGSNEVYCFGNGASGQMGNIIPTSYNKPNTAIVSLPTAIGIWRTASGGDHSCAWSVAGTVWCWGTNSFGELGKGTISAFYDASAQVLNLQAITPGNRAVALGLHHSCAIVSGGLKVQCWGDNSAGQLGNSEINLSSSPMDVVGLPIGATVSSIYANGNQTCAIVGATNVPYCWGDNSLSQLAPTLIGTAPSGNVVRILCGNNTGGPSGICNGVTTAHTIYTLSGQSGQIGNQGTGDGRYARGALFANLFGITYDAYKNLIVSSGGFVSTSNTYTDFSIRTINYEVPGPLMTAKYGFTDSNNLSSFYCLRLKPLTSCDSTGACSCRLVPPTDLINPNFWDLRSQNAICN